VCISPALLIVSYRYGIEGIAQTYEDPFGVAKIDINMDDIVEDTRKEVEVLLAAWQTQGAGNGGIFRPRVGDTPKSDDSSEFYTDDIDQSEDIGSRNQVRFVVSDLSQRNGIDDSMEIRDTRSTRTSSAASPGTVGVEAGGSSDYFEVA